MNYLILVAKLCIWDCSRGDCRKNLNPPRINAFKIKVRVKIRYETENLYALILITWTNLIRNGIRAWALYLNF